MGYFDEITKGNEVEMRFRSEVSNFLKTSFRLVLASRFRDIPRDLVIFTK